MTTTDSPPASAGPVTRLDAATFDTTELFYGRMILSGLDWGDITRALSGVQKATTYTDWADWHRRWVELGAEYEHRANEAFAAGNIESGRFATRRAAACFHFAEFMYVDEPGVKLATRARVDDVFGRARRHLSIRGLDIRYGDLELPGYVMAPGEGPWPAVILVNGLDSAKEVELYAFAREFVARGIAAVVFDGPGQGVLAGRVPMVIEFEDVIGAVLEQLAARPEVDTSRIGIFGVSFGGYLAARAAAHHPQLRCCVNLAGGHDHDNYPAINEMVRKGFQFVFDAPDQTAMARIATEALHLRDTPPLQVPLLALEGEQSDVIAISAVERMARWAAGETRLVRFPGERHVATNRFGEAIPLITDWTATRLRATAP